MTDILELIKENRSFRRFSQCERPDASALRRMIEAARLSASAGNKQRLRFTPVFDDETCEEIFKNLAFAAYFGGWRPSEEEKPTAYVVIFAEDEFDVNLAMDTGIASQSILLTARDMGFGGCIFRSINVKAVSELLGKEGFTPVTVIALGKPSEKVVITEIKDGDVKYYRDDAGTHFVPKRALDDIII